MIYVGNASSTVDNLLAPPSAIFSICLLSSGFLDAPISVLGDPHPQAAKDRCEGPRPRHAET